MQTWLIERRIPNAGKLTAQELQAISQKSCGVLGKLGKDIRWCQSYVTADAIYCIYEAKNEHLVREHARLGGFPADRVLPVGSTISPATATGAAAKA
jgi:hypothetical protein